MSSQFQRLDTYAQQWNVLIEDRWETETSLLASGLRGGTRVVLKITKQPCDEWHSGEILRAFAGDGIVEVYESSPGAVLLRRLDPGTDLVELVRQGNDDAATEILAGVMKQLAHHEPPVVCPTVLDWSRSFDRYLNTGPKLISDALVTHAASLFNRLALSQTNPMLLHGDLQHYNVLFDSTRGWVAIDPKGVVGEIEYEVGAMMRNPVDLPDRFTSRDVIEHRLRTLTNNLKLDYRRALEWTFAQSVLSAIWDIEDGYAVKSDHPALRLAHELRPLVS
jgi:streptomycin 6-kinase